MNDNRKELWKMIDSNPSIIMFLRNLKPVIGFFFPKINSLEIL